MTRARSYAGWLLTLALALWMVGHLLRWRPVGAGLVAAELAATALLFAAGLLAGAGLARRLGGERVPPPERLVHALALGLGVLVTTVLLVGLSGLLSAPVVLLAAALVTAAAAMVGRRGLPWALASPREMAGELRRPAIAAGGVALAAALAMPLAAALLPETFYDALLYHLEAPERWLAAGSLAGVPYSVHLNFPVNASALYLLVRSLVPAASAGLVHWGFLVASAVTLVALGRRLGRGVGIVAALLYCVTPSVLETGSLAIADHAVVFWTLAAAAAWLSWRERGDDKLLVLCGLEVGLAIGAKYTAVLIGLFPLGILTLLAAGRRTPGRRLRDAALLGAVALAAFSPWLVRNTVETGNPIYPYVFPAGEEFATSHTLEVEVTNRMAEGSGLLRLARHAVEGPADLLTTGVGAAPLVGLALFLPLPLLLLRRPLAPPLGALLAMAGLAFVAWDLTVHVTRYALPWLALLALPSAAALVGEAHTVRRRIVGTLVALGLVQNLYLASMATDWTALRDIMRGARTRDSYLSEYVSYYPAVRHANEHLAPTDRILFFAEARAFYCRIPHVTSGPERTPRLYEIAAGSPGEPLASALGRHGFTHLLLSRSELDRYTRQGRLAPPEPAVERAVSTLLERDLEVLFDDGNVLLGRLRPGAAGLTPGSGPPR